jgi:hypothetical protein
MGEAGMRIKNKITIKNRGSAGTSWGEAEY